MHEGGLNVVLRPISISVALAARAKRTALEHAQLELLRNIFSSLMYARIVLKVERVSTFSARRSERYGDRPLKIIQYNNFRTPVFSSYVLSKFTLQINICLFIYLFFVEIHVQLYEDVII